MNTCLLIENYDQLELQVTQRREAGLLSTTLDKFNYTLKPAADNSNPKIIQIWSIDMK